jgi:hypothetical protein
MRGVVDPSRLDGERVEVRGDFPRAAGEGRVSFVIPDDEGTRYGEALELNVDFHYARSFLRAGRA